MVRKSHLLVLTLSFSSALFAEQKLTFEDSIALAVKSNLEVQASYEALKASQADKKSTRSAFFPKVSASLSYEKANSETKSGASSTTDAYSGSLNLTQNLFNGFQDSASLKIADSKIQTEEANLQETKSQISYDLKNAVANYFYAKDSLNLSRDIKKRREDNLRMVELRFENGRENKGSVLLSKAYLEQAKLDLFKAENAMATSLIYLRRVLNLPENEPVEITTTPAIDDPGVPDYDALIESTPTAKKFKATLASASATLDSSKAGFYPDLNVSASVGKTGDSFFPDDNRRWAAGATLSWSLFDGGKDFYSTYSASYQVKAAEKRLENQNMELRRVLSQSYTSFKEANQTVKVSSAFLEAAKVRADISRSKYNNGLSNFDDWDLIENDLITKQKDYTLQIRNRLQASAAWEQAQGTGVIP
nr:TolC family protein [Bacteriovorax sp. HI3]